jgi:hypothetical protein
MCGTTSQGVCRAYVALVAASVGEGFECAGHRREKDRFQMMKNATDRIHQGRWGGRLW